MLHVKEILKSEEEAEKILEEAKKEAEAIISQARRQAAEKQDEELKSLLANRDLELKKAQEEAAKARDKILAKSHEDIRAEQAKHKSNRDKAVRFIVEGILS